jgi:spore germination protein Q
MNDNYYQNPTFPGQPMPTGTPNQQTAPPSMPMFPQAQPTTEVSYVENILRINKGKMAKLYFSYPDSVEWRDKIFEGIVEQAGRDHVILSDPKTGKWYVLLIIYLNYAVFDEPINYSLTFATPPKS